jgi:hypothetical protein
VIACACLPAADDSLPPLATQSNVPINATQTALLPVPLEKVQLFVVGGCPGRLPVP